MSRPSLLGAHYQNGLALHVHSPELLSARIACRNKKCESAVGACAPAVLSYVGQSAQAWVAFARVPLHEPTLVRCGDRSGVQDRGTRLALNNHVDETKVADNPGQALAMSATQELVEARQDLISERAAVARFHDELIRIVGHDLRAPLGAIEVSIEMLATASDSAVATARISSFTRRLSRIVDHVVDLTRARLGGGIPLARTYTRLVPLITGVVREVAAAHPQHQIVIVHLDDVRAFWDQERIAQVVRTLLTNAAQYGRECGTVEVDARSHADGEATITVHNELQGMPLAAEALATMFDAYRRGSDDAHIGTGIGLSLFLAQQIVHAHRGSISVESSPAGTSFHVVLPDVVTQ